MPRISLPFGERELYAELPTTVTKVLPKAALNHSLEQQLAKVKETLDNPIGTLPLRDLVRGKERVAVVVSDMSRLAPTSVFLPLILEDIGIGGVRTENITIVIGTGNHRAITPEEKLRLVGEEVFHAYKCRDSKEGQYIRVGITSRGTPIEVSEYVAKADFTVLTGNIELHRLAGFSGGAKAAVGVSSRQAIEENHKISHLGPFQPGKLDENPVRADLEQYAAILKAHFLFNVVTDERGNIEAAFSGDIIEAHREGADYAKEKYHVPVPNTANLVIVSAGGTPKDDSLYQGLKAIQNGMDILEEGGILIAVASCREGFGDSVFKEWATQYTVKETINRGDKEFVLGGHKAVILGGLFQKGRIFLISELDNCEAREAGFVPFKSLQEAVDTALAEVDNTRIVVIPYGGVTVPYLVRQWALKGN